MSASIVTWNCNSLRSRLPHLIEMIDAHAPDVILLQELKLEDPVFPYEQIEEKGYNCAVYGQKSYNGVAILSRVPFDEVRKGLADRALGEGDEQARYIEADITLGSTSVCVASIYVPNGQSVGSDKFAYKLNFFERLEARVGELMKSYEHIVLGGDYNIAPRPVDVWDPKRLEGTVCFHPAERAGLRRLIHQGMSDAWVTMRPNDPGFTWWDYRQNGFERGFGMRIDHLLCSPEAMDRMEAIEILVAERIKERPSDHAPVMGRFAF